MGHLYFFIYPIFYLFSPPCQSLLPLATDIFDTLSEDPEYIFADGKVTSGLRQEEGKTKVIILDEFNSAAPNIVIRLHEVLDALERDGTVVLAEDASETLDVSKKKTKVVALMNPPGKGYFGREPLDPAQIRRWVYHKVATELPPETFSHATDALFSLAPQTQEADATAFLQSRDTVLLPEQLQEIPGIKEILARYKEFHAAAKELVKSRQVAADQPQQFTFDDRMEPRRVRDFVLTFFNGDINGTFQEALKYYYSNKLGTEEDRAMLEELIRNVVYKPAETASKRRGLDTEDELPIPATNNPDHAPTPRDPETPFAGAFDRERADIVKNEQIAWKEVLGVTVAVPPLPEYVTDEVLDNLEAAGFQPFYLPTLDLKPGSLTGKSFRGSKSVKDYLKEIQRAYPKWKPYESLSDEEKFDPLVSRNLSEWYWEQVKDGKTAMPDLRGKWVAAETVKKPNYGEHYEETPVATMMGLKDRFNVSWKEATALANRVSPGIVGPTGLSLRGQELRLPEVAEWNLLANREGWGESNSYEWTNTPYSGSLRLIAGVSDNGGAASVHWDNPEGRNDTVGFRLLVDL